MRFLVFSQILERLIIIYVNYDMYSEYVYINYDTDSMVFKENIIFELLIKYENLFYFSVEYFFFKVRTYLSKTFLPIIVFFFSS